MEVSEFFPHSPENTSAVRIQFRNLHPLQGHQSCRVGGCVYACKSNGDLRQHLAGTGAPKHPQHPEEWLFLKNATGCIYITFLEGSFCFRGKILQEAVYLFLNIYEKSTGKCFGSGKKKEKWTCSAKFMDIVTCLGSRRVKILGKMKHLIKTPRVHNH